MNDYNYLLMIIKSMDKDELKDIIMFAMNDPDVKEMVDKIEKGVKLDKDFYNRTYDI